MIDFKAICRNKTDRCHEDCNVCAYFVTTEQSDIRQVYQQGKAEREAEIVSIIEQMKESASAMMWTERECACEKILEQIKEKNNGSI